MYSILIRWLWKGYWIGAGHENEQATIRSLEVSALPPPPGKEGGARNGVNDWSFFYDEAFIKCQKYGIQRAFRLVNRIMYQKSGVSQLHRESILALGTLPDFALCISHLAV